MFDPPWKHLVEELKKQGHESPYLDRLRERLPATRGGALADLQREMLEEMASALRRAEEKVLVALLKLDVLGKELDALDAKPRRDAADEQLRQKKLQRFAAVREEAKTAVWELKVHREALGFRRNEELARLYPIPSARS